MGVLGREAGKHAARFHRGNVACPLTCVSKARETETQNRPTGGSPGAVFATRSGCVFNAEMEPLPSMVFTSALEPSRLHQDDQPACRSVTRHAAPRGCLRSRHRRGGAELGCACWVRRSF